LLSKEGKQKTYEKCLKIRVNHTNQKKNIIKHSNELNINSLFFNKLKPSRPQKKEKRKEKQSSSKNKTKQNETIYLNVVASVYYKRTDNRFCLILCFQEETR